MISGWLKSNEYAGRGKHSFGVIFLCNNQLQLIFLGRPDLREK
jgi:hypothetical protein